MRTSGFVVEKQFLVGSILSRTFAMAFKRPGLFFGFPLACVFIADAAFWLLSSYFSPWGPLNRCLVFFWGILTQGFIAFAVYQILAGNEPTFTQSFLKALPRLFVLVIVRVLTVVCVWLGSLFFVVPGLLLAASWSVAMQVTVVERKGFMASMNRSEALTKGNRMRIMVLLLLVTGGGWFISDFSPLFMAPLRVAGSWRLIACYNLVKMIFVVFNSVMYAVIYFDLRSILEDIAPVHLSRVFD